ncbi:hypothetical protein CFT12S00416_05580 [Campylobacter fetus subsp. testudinum]|nr:hypothetical protein CFT12S00416_05580 [Campylobacter fetus subsp. testudinum]
MWYIGEYSYGGLNYFNLLYVLSYIIIFFSIINIIKFINKFFKNKFLDDIYTILFYTIGFSPANIVFLFMIYGTVRSEFGIFYFYIFCHIYLIIVKCFIYKNVVNNIIEAKLHIKHTDSKVDKKLNICDKKYILVQNVLIPLIVLSIVFIK